MQRRTRNIICIWVIFGGLINFLAYTIFYAELGGDAKNGWKEAVRDDRGNTTEQYYISGHFLRSGDGRDRPVPKWVWVYSYIHSISLWPTQGAMVICMLILARPHIIATMTEGSWIRGPTFITVVITLTAVLCSVLTILFTIQFLRDLLR
ncbi:MAG TPA: hypothetical protein VLM89_14270 [Phycisphaerae bacterium]|nr:hypothetical protein [Phycisphaerae bacterium]